MKKVLLSVVMSVLIISLMLGVSGCAKPAPAPAPTPAPAPAPKPAPAPTPAPAPHAQVSIRIRGGIPNGNGYQEAFGLADLLNKKHPWLRAVVLTSSGSAEDAMALAKNPEEKKTTIAWIPDSTTWGLMTGAQPYFKETYDGLRFLFAGKIGASGLVTLDPNIREIKDLVGKKVNVLPPSGAANLEYDTVFAGMDAIMPGFTSKIDRKWTDWTAGHQALRDGLIDASYAGVNAPPAGETKWSVSSYAAETMMKPAAHFINVPKEAILKGKELGKYPDLPIDIPAGAIKDGSLPVTLVAEVLSYSCDVSFPEDVAYEIAKFAYEHTADLMPYCSAVKSWTKENRAQWPLGIKNVHPGAVKFYKEAGIPIPD